MKKAILLSGMALLLAAGGCAKKPASEANVNANAAYQYAEPVAQDDGSMITTSASSSGNKTEVRYFPTGEVIQVSRATWPEGRRVATIKMRDGRTVDLQDPTEIDQAMTASNQTLAAFALKAMGVSGAPAKAANANAAGGQQEGAAKAEKKGKN